MRLLSVIVLVVGICACVASGASRPVVALHGARIAVGTWKGSLRVAPPPKRSPSVFVGARKARVTSRGDGRYAVTIALRAPGTWRVRAVVSRRRYDLGSIRVPGFEGAAVARACRDTSIPYPPYALAAGFDSLWVACRKAGTIERRDAAGDLVDTIRLGDFHPWSVATGGGSLWAVERDRPVLAQVDPASGRVTLLPLDEPPIYVWFGAGAAWVVFDASGSIARIDPATGTVTGRFVLGGGPSGFAADDTSVWIISHRSGDVVRIEGDRLTHLGSHFADARSAPERLALTPGSLWVTGRGLDLERLDPATGTEQASVEIGAAGIDLVASGSRLHVFAATPAGAARGDPTVAAVVTVDPAGGSVIRRRSATSLSLTGLASTSSHVYADDALHGALVSGSLR
jgi:DNA-binding beta-propeller fold protein YncE